MRKRHGRVVMSVALVTVAGLIAAACGGDDGGLQAPTTTEGSTETTAAPDTSEAPDTTEASSSGNVVSDVAGAQAATIRIRVQGTIRDPEIGRSYSGGTGSGFLISPDGLAVTNNHVVTGAATLEVFVGGDNTKSYNAQILGVSECSDLAVIKISGLSDAPYFEWYDGEVTTGLDVYAAGFPLGTEEFTLTRGIVAKARADGDITGTASVDYTIEHDANIQPGNSGGPLINSDGKVVGVNYAGGAMRTTTAQFFAIAAPLAKDMVERLKEGDAESIGVNGWAVYDETLGVSGIWVAGVAAGSPASKAGVLPGDIITSLQGLPMGVDGTFKDYCDVLRTAGDRPMSIEVLRWDTSEVLEGELNSDKVLTTTFSFADEIGEQTDLAAGETYTDFETVVDDTGTIRVQVPTAWRDRDLAPFQFDSGDIAPYIGAAPSLSGYLNSWDTPGVEMISLTEDQTGDLDAQDLLDTFSPGDACNLSASEGYEDPAFLGVYELWTSCGGTNTSYVVLIAYPKDGRGSSFILVFQAVTDADIDVLRRVLDTFNYT